MTIHTSRVPSVRHLTRLLGAVGLAAGLTLLSACSMLGLGSDKQSASTDEGTPPKTLRTAANPKASPDKSPKAAKSGTAPSPDALQANSTDLQSMFEAMEKVQAPAAPPPSPASQPTPAASTPPQNAQAATDKAPEPARVQQPAQPQPTPAPVQQPPTLVASTIAVSDGPAPAPAPSTTPPPATPTSATPSTSAPSPAAPSASPAKAQSGTLDIGAIALCSRVESFGRYAPLTSSTFPAGRAAQMILYTELAGFTQRPDDTGATSQYVTELGQSVDLYLDSDGSRQFTIPRQSVRELSRSKRRDFYLVQRVTLPATLSVGRYNLKVRALDIASGQETERSLPIQIVADPAAARPTPAESRSTPRTATGPASE